MKDLRVRKKATNLAGLLVMVLLLSVFPACNPLDSTLLTPAPTSFVEASPTPIDEMPYKGDGSKYVCFPQGFIQEVGIVLSAALRIQLPGRIPKFPDGNGSICQLGVSVQIIEVEICKINDILLPFAVALLLHDVCHELSHCYGARDSVCISSQPCVMTYGSNVYNVWCAQCQHDIIDYIDN